MSGLARLIALYALRNPIQTGLVAISLAVVLAVPLAGRMLVARYESRIAARAAAVPIVIGSPGSRFDLALTAVYFRRSPIAPVPLAVCDALQDEGRVTAVPIHARFTASGRTVVAVGAEYFERMRLVTVSGTFPVLIGDATLGSAAAAQLGLGPGDELVTDRRELYDLSVPPPFALRIVGVLAPTGGPDDEAVFTGIDTAWVLEGRSHSHTDPSDVGEGQVLARTDGLITVAPTLDTARRVSDADVLSFHIHGDRGGLPLSAVLVFDDDQKDLTIVTSRINAQGDAQAVVPSVLVEELFAIVLRVRAVFDAIAAVLGGATLLLVCLTAALAARLRLSEFLALERMGVPSWYVAGLVAGQTGVVLALGGLGAAVLVAGVLLAASGIISI
jgi:putative ABC transport system permease protein